jgi:hypothetical protein
MSVEPLPVVRIEQMDGSHEHPNVRALRADIERLRAEVEYWKGFIPVQVVKDFPFTYGEQQNENSQ